MCNSPRPQHGGDHCTSNGSKNNDSKKKDSKSRHQGVKLFSASKSYFSPKETSDKHQTKFKTRPDLLAHRKQLKSEADENEAFKSMAVTPEWVLEQHGVHYKGPDESRSKVITEL